MGRALGDDSSRLLTPIGLPLYATGTSVGGPPMVYR